MRIPSLAEPLSGRKLEGPVVVLLSTGMAVSGVGSWSLRQASDRAYGVEGSHRPRATNLRRWFSMRLRTPCRHDQNMR